MYSSWIKLSRDSSRHWTFSDPVKFKMWIQLLLDLNLVDSSVTIRGIDITCSAGQSIRSLVSWSELLNVSRKQVRTFFAQLERSGHIRFENLEVTSRITLLCGEAEPKSVKPEKKISAKKAPVATIAADPEYITDIAAFEPFYNRYPGNKLPMEVEFGYFREHFEQACSDILPLLLPGIEREIKQMTFLRSLNRFVRPYCAMRKWLRQQMWAQEFEKYQYDPHLDGPVYPRE